MARWSALARTVDLDPVRSASAQQIASRFHALYGPALARLPAGRQVFHGLPFDLGTGPDAPRWILLDAPRTIELPAVGVVSHVVVAHLCDTWRSDTGERPPGLPIGHGVPVGEPLARYSVADAAGPSTDRLIRRRFEINDGILGWGSVAFAAIPHLANEVLDWRGPHAAQGPGRYAPTGQSGMLTIMPGTYGANQVGMTDFVPSPTDDALLWLHAIELPAAAEPTALRLEPLAGGRPGSDVIVAAVTLFSGSANPLSRGPRFQVRVAGLGGRAPEVDLGTVIRTRPAPAKHAALPKPPAAEHEPDIVGWGRPRLDLEALDASPSLVDLAISPDAVVSLGSWDVRGIDLLAGRPVRDLAGRRSIEVLAPARVPIEVDIVDPSSGEPLAGRVRFIAADGRYLAPVGHRDEINPGFYEDTGGDLLLGSTEYAYVPGRFDIDLPVGTVEVEVVGGFERTPYRSPVDIEPWTRHL